MDVERQKEFLSKYESLVKEFNMKIAAIPKWIHRDDGSFSMIIDLAIMEFKPDAPNSIPK
jgi:hypothetical protein